MFYENPPLSLLFAVVHRR